MQCVTKNKTQTGFTLIELLVVISIIGILISVAVVVYSNVNRDGRDSERRSDIARIDAAIKMYLSDNNTYPVCTSEFIDAQSGCLYNALVPDYLPTMPVDPVYGNDGTASNYDYQYWGNSGGYGLRVALEGQPLEFTHAYPNGNTYCGISASDYPVCTWYQNCVYPGYSADCDGQAIQIGDSS